MSYIGSGSSDGGDRYVGLDRFGRIINQNWENGSSVSNEDFQYGYDQDGNVLYKNNVYAPTFSELYHANSGATGDDSSAYNGLGQLQGFRRGTLSSSGNNGAGLDTVTTGDLNSIASDNTATYSLDALGNRTSSGANSKNEITGDDYAYDHNGNMTVDATGNTFVYDAWNRLVTGSQLSADYSYDALGRRIGFDLASESLNNDWYYSADGHVIQEALCGSTIFDQYVWSLAGPNDLVLMDSNATDNTGDGYNLGKSGSSLGERVYIEQDANEDVTALVGPTGGTALEHFIYDNYGAMQVMNGTYTATTTDAYNTVYLWQGERLDFATGLYHCGVRDERPTDGTWQEAEPSGGAYINGMNLYQADGSNPVTLSDPTGLYKIDWNGSSNWTAAEKQRLYDLLGRVRHHALESIKLADAAIARLKSSKCDFSDAIDQLKKARDVLQKVADGIGSSTEELEFVKKKFSPDADLQYHWYAVGTDNIEFNMSAAPMTWDKESDDMVGSNLLHELSHKYGTLDDDSAGPLMNAHNLQTTYADYARDPSKNTMINSWIDKDERKCK